MPDAGEALLMPKRQRDGAQAPRIQRPDGPSTRERQEVAPSVAALEPGPDPSVRIKLKPPPTPSSARERPTPEPSADRTVPREEFLGHTRPLDERLSERLRSAREPVAHTARPTNYALSHEEASVQIVRHEAAPPSDAAPTSEQVPDQAETEHPDNDQDGSSDRKGGLQKYLRALTGSR